VVEIVGRDKELGFLDAFLDRADGGSMALGSRSDSSKRLAPQKSPFA
jgi:hypothetical protein